jgi:hypothetical protein
MRRKVFAANDRSFANDRRVKYFAAHQHARAIGVRKFFVIVLKSKCRLVSTRRSHLARCGLGYEKL